MASVVGNTGDGAILNARFNNSWPDGGKNLTAKLYTNNTTPDQGTVVGDFTEAAGGGYVPKILECGNWTVNPAHVPRDAVYPTQVFMLTGALTGNASVRGYYVVDADNVYQWSDNLPEPFTPSNNGDHVDIDITYQSTNE